MTDAKTDPTPPLSQRQRDHLFFTWSVQREVQPLTIVGAQGARFETAEHGWLWDLESQVYNVNVGHGSETIRARMRAQIDDVAAAAPNAVLPVRAELGALLRRHTGLHRAFLTTGGSEAVENAIKIARLVTGRGTIVTRRRSYHGATLAVLGVAGDPRKRPFERHLAPAVHIDDPYPHGEHGETPSEWVRSLEGVLAREGPETIAATLLEGFTGTNGMQLPPPDFWPRVRELCDAYGILLIDDEIFSGFGRTGEWFAHRHWGVTPDMMVIGKGLTSGYAPLAGVVVSREVAEHFEARKLWCGLTTYAHPVSCAAAVGSITALEDRRLVDNARAVGRVLGERLTALGRPGSPLAGVIGDVRGLGLMWLVELDRSVRGLGDEFLKRGLYVPSRDNWMFVCPPLCITEAEVHTVCDALESALVAGVGGTTRA